MTILVTGGAGYIGSHTIIELIASGHSVVVVDNLCNSSMVAIERVEKITGASIPFYEADIRDKDAISAILDSHTIDACIHFAGLKAVGESVTYPHEYYDNNITGTLNLIGALRSHNIKNIIFSSSATVYGEPQTIPITEDCPKGICTNPYGWTKWMIEQMLTDLHTADSTYNIVLLRYFNPIGAHESSLIGENPNGIPNNLMPYITQVAVGKRDKLHIFGNDYDTPDGTGVRDYIHVVDLARGHVKALDAINRNCGVAVYNLGTGKGYSVLDIVKAFEAVNDVKIPYVIDPRRSGDIATCYSDPTKAWTALGWKAEYGIEEMCRDSWNWQRKNPDGYGTDVDPKLMVAFLFDSGKVTERFMYGYVIFEEFFTGNELEENRIPVIVSHGDIMHGAIFDDLQPFLIKDELCTVDRNHFKLKDRPYVIVVEDVCKSVADKIDTRLKTTSASYLGMTSVNVDTKDSRKQYWKLLFREFKLKGKEITYFGISDDEDCENGFFIADFKKLGYDVSFDEEPVHLEELPLFRKSSFIHAEEQLETMEGDSDSDRGLTEMNYSLVKEVGISGVLIWKAIEDINHVYIPNPPVVHKNSDITDIRKFIDEGIDCSDESEFEGCTKTDYVFTSLYQASQGIERLLKIAIEILKYKEDFAPDVVLKVDKILYSHSHESMLQFLTEHCRIKLKPYSTRLIQLLSDFYNKARYNRYHYNQNNTLEIRLFYKLGHDIPQEAEDFDSQIKHLYGRALSDLSKTIYSVIESLCIKLGIFAYELDSISVANYVVNDYYGNDIYEMFKRIERSRKEFLFYWEYHNNPDKQSRYSIKPLPFTELWFYEINEVIREITASDESCWKLYDEVNRMYDEICKEKKENLGERIRIIDEMYKPFHP